MSRLKHAVVVAVVLAVVVGCLLAPRSRDSRAFAAVANAMAKVASLHYTSEPALPGTQNQRSEIWSTPSATKSVSGGVWYMWKQGTTYTYISRYKVLFISPAIGADTGVMFNSLVNPRMIADMNGVQSFHVKVRDVELDGRPMLRMEIDFTKDVTQEDRKESERLRKKIAEVISEREKREKPQSRVERVYEHEYVTHIRLIYTIDPSTNLVRSMDLYIPDNKNGGWRLIERFRSFEYNIDLPDDFFDVKTPPGTKVYDLRDEPNHEVGHNASHGARG